MDRTRKTGTGVQTVGVSVETDLFHLLGSKNKLYCNLETKVMSHQKRDGWRGRGEEEEERGGQSWAGIIRPEPGGILTLWLVHVWLQPSLFNSRHL